MNTYKVRFVPIGGVVGVTKNMYLYELYNGDVLQDIVVVDCGIGFPTEKELGVDFLIPDITYLRDKTDYIRAILLTHGHEDHISALPYLYQELGMPKVYASKLTTAFIKNKCKEANIEIDIAQIEYGKEYCLGGIRAEYIHVTHSIPDTTHILIKTPIGTLYHGSDYKFDLTPPYGNPPDFHRITRAGTEGVLCLMSDCLGSEREGITLSESIVGQAFENEMRNTKGKFIMTTFASNISRIHQCVEAAIKFNRSIVFLGRSMHTNTRVALELGYLRIPKSLTADEEDISRIPPNRLCIIAAGSQGQYRSAMSKLATKQNRFARIQKGDKVVFSSDPIPGNEHEVYALIEELYTQGAEVIYPNIRDQLHASGHGNQEDIKLLVRFTNPRYFVPIGGTVRHQRQYEKLCVEMGHNSENVLLLKEGQTTWFVPNKAWFGDSVETRNIYVDAYGVDNVGHVILRDRKTLSSDGIATIFLALDKENNLLGEPIISSKGFVFKENEAELFSRAQDVIKQSVKKQIGPTMDMHHIKKEINNEVEKFFSQALGKHPLVVVEVIKL